MPAIVEADPGSGARQAALGSLHPSSVRVGDDSTLTLFGTCQKVRGRGNAPTRAITGSLKGAYLSSDGSLSIVSRMYTAGTMTPRFSGLSANSGMFDFACWITSPKMPWFIPI